MTDKYAKALRLGPPFPKERGITYEEFNEYRATIQEALQKAEKYDRVMELLENPSEEMIEAANILFEMPPTKGELERYESGNHMRVSIFKAMIEQMKKELDYE